MFQSKNGLNSWRSRLVFGLIVALCAQLMPVQVAGADAPAADYIVLFSNNTDLQTKISKEARLGNAISQVYDNVANGFVAELDAADVRRLKADRDVLVVELDRVIRLDDEAVVTTSTSTSSTTSTSTSSTTSTSTSVPTTSTTVLPTTTSSTTSTTTSTSTSSTILSTTTSSTTSTSTSSTTSVPTPATDPDGPVANSYIITLRKDVSAQQFVSAEQGLGVNVLGAFTVAINGYVAVLTDSEKDRLLKDQRVTNIERDSLIEVDGDQVNPPSWGLDRIDQRGPTNLDGSNSNYSYNFSGVGVTAYIIDTGIRADHAQFSGRVSVGYTAISDGRGSADCNGHGTHVAGTVGGSTTGVAKSVALVPVRVLGCGGSGSVSGVIAGINWMITNHISGEPAVANMSLGSAFSLSLNTAVENAFADGIVMAVAAGNNNLNACNYSPASAPSAITVGATNAIDERASYSNYGSCLDIFAPGSSITSSWFTSSTALAGKSGTSMASPHVAGAAALLLEADSAMSPAAVATKLLTYATPDVVVGAGCRCWVRISKFIAVYKVCLVCAGADCAKCAT
ncbi:MAG: S8 family serine peptidase [Actinobacteria bacterium]|nr:S8 family serine peptidase [Actinomycetota bacterium]